MKKIFLVMAAAFAAAGELLHDKLFSYMAGVGMVLAFSIIPKPPMARKNVANESGGPTTALGKIKLHLDRSFLVEEHVLEVFVSQTFGTNAPSSADPRDAFTHIALYSDKFGELISAPFSQVYDLAAFTENAPAPVFVAGAGGGAAATVRFFLDLHHELDGATLDLITALQTEEHGALYIELTCADNAANCFKGGTGTLGTAAYTVSVDEKAYPDWSGKQISAGGIHYGRAYQTIKALKDETGAASASSKEISLTTGKTRFLVIHTIDTNAAPDAYANGILDKITSLKIGERDYFNNVSAEAIQADNIAKRNNRGAGVYVLDFGDDHRKWPDVKSDGVKLKYTTKATAPAAWTVKVMQVAVHDIEKALGGQHRH